MAEIVRGTPTSASIEGFHKLAKNSLAERLILICQTPLSNLARELQSHIERLGVDFFDETIVSTELAKKNVSESDVQDYSKLFNAWGAQLLADALPEVALQRIPESMREDVEKSGIIKAWQILEHAAYSVFQHCFIYTVEKWGGERLFENEPEGLVVVGDKASYAFIYECKSAAKSYAMTSDHEERYIGYIRDKKPKIERVQRSELKYFVIIAPAFSGEIGERRERIFKETQVLVIFLPAEVLRILGKWAYGVPNNLKGLVDFAEVCKLNELIVSKESVESYIKKFEDEYKTRW
jgi:hypothetical protein